MSFERFKQWLSDELTARTRFDTLGGRSYFHAYYHHDEGLIFLILRTGYRGQLRDDQVEEIYNRYNNGTPSERNMTSFYTDPWWPDTPSRILAPAIPAIIKVWIDQEG